MEPEPSAAMNGRRFSITVPNTAAAATMARRRLLSFLESNDISAEDLADIAIAAGEALANAAEHGHRPSGQIQLEAQLRDDGIEVSVSDDGPGFTPGPHPVPKRDVLSPRGFGLYLMHTLMDAVEVRNDGRTIWFLKRLPMGNNPGL